MDPPRVVLDSDLTKLFVLRRKSAEEKPPLQKDEPKGIVVVPKYDNTPNTNFAWLTYESFFNKEQFQHTNNQLELKSYSMPLKDLRVIIASSLTSPADTEDPIPPAIIEEIRKAFFPELNDITVLKSIAYCPWFQKGQVPDLSQFGGKHGRMPYNFLANEMRSPALGTRANPQGTCEMRCLQQQWSMWQTASRSCVVRLDSIGALELAPPTPPVFFPRMVGDQMVDLLWSFNPAKGDKFPDPVDVKSFDLGNMFDHQDPVPKCFSLKSGAYRVGTEDQVASKGTLETDGTSILGALNSEWINVLQSKFKDLAKTLAEDIIILPEILTVTCTNIAIDKGYNDGFQLRDLRQMNIKNKYFPAISIPYVGPMQGSTPVDFVHKVPAWSALLHASADLDNGWIKYWSQHFAAKLGRAKAILHLCYGLQCLTPNSQNFLLEYTEHMEPTGKIFLRDVIDMKLHTDWVRTVLGCAKNNESLKSFFDVKVKHIDSKLYDLLEFEATLLTPKLPNPVAGRVLIQDNETFEDIMSTFNTKVIQYYKDTQMNWFAYTSLFNGTLPSQMGGSKPLNWQDALAINTYWGFIHAQSYISVINDCLHLNIPYDVKTLDELPLEPATGLTPTQAKFKHLTKALDSTDLVEVAASENRPFLFMANLYTIWSLPNDPAGCQRASNLHSLYCQWERRVSKMVHDAMYGSEQGQQALRIFHGLK